MFHTNITPDKQLSVSDFKNFKIYPVKKFTMPSFKTEIILNYSTNFIKNSALVLTQCLQNFNLHCLTIIFNLTVSRKWMKSCQFEFFLNF